MAAPWWQLDWVWTATGWVLFGAGVVLLLWALFWDRARGRRRCPKCWYDMSGVPFTTRETGQAWICPECGRESQKKRSLQKTRRRWRWAIVAIALVIGGDLARSLPGIRSRGWWAAAPRLALILAMPYIDDAGPTNLRRVSQNPLEDEIRLRLDPDAFDRHTMYLWERWPMTRVCAAMLKGSSSDETKNLAAQFYVILNDDAVDRAPERGRAAIILATSAKTYAQMNSFRCTGEAGERRFLIAFDRPKRRFRFEYVDSRSRYVIWRNESGDHDWWSIAGSDRARGSLSLALAGATGVSGGAAHTVPRLLLPKEVSGTRITDSLATRVGRVEKIDGHDCWRIDGQWWNGGNRSVWIDCQTYMLRQEDRDLHYVPECGIAIDPAWFKFDPAKPSESPLK